MHSQFHEISLKNFFDPDYCFIIAEAGVNHNGELKRALELVDIASDAGADAVKFQTFKPGELTGAFTPNVAYINTPNAKPRDQLTKQLALDFEYFRGETPGRRQGASFLEHAGWI